ncbi:MAG: hypothetical protein BRC26_01390, partial [Nanohaloarchaea archaeon QH_8_44_6]
METQTREAENMTFNAVKQTNQKLHSNPEISDHNKQVLDEFFRTMQTRGTGESTLKDYASRFNSIAEHIDFKLDQAERRDIESIVAGFNTDRITKRNEEPYSDYSKKKFWKTIRVFYKTFMDKKGKGFNEELDGTELIEDLEISTNINYDIDLDTRPTPEHIQSVAEQTNNLRDRALIQFGWATGARIGELLYTDESHKYPKGIKWEDIRFNGDEMWVTLRGKTGEREIPIRTSKPLMKRLWEQSEKELESHVFKEKNMSNLCPKCNSRVYARDRSTYERRTYGCDSCGWEDNHEKAKKEKKPLKDSAARKRLKRLMAETDIPDILHRKPHKVFRAA